MIGGGGGGGRGQKKGAGLEWGAGTEGQWV